MISLEKQASSFWDRVKEEIAANFTTWFQNTNAVIDDDLVIIECENEFQRDWIQAMYGKLIGETVYRMLGKEMRILLAANGERKQLEQRLEQRFQTPITIGEYILSMEKRASELEERVKRCEQIINELLKHRPVH